MHPDQDNDPWEIFRRGFYYGWEKETSPATPSPPSKRVLHPYVPPGSPPGIEDGPLPVTQKMFVGGVVDEPTRSIAIMLYDGDINPYDQNNREIFAILLSEKDMVLYISYLQELLAILRSRPVAPIRDILQ